MPQRPVAVRSGSGGDGSATPAGQPLAAVAPQRVAWIDRARGAALLAMILYHFCFDLRLLGLVDWPVGTHLLWRACAIAIAASFIALSGLSLQLAASRGLDARSFLRRLAKLAVAALLVTLGSWIAMPHPITFGILHAIATFSVLALPFLRAPTWLVLATALAVFLLPLVYGSEAFSAPWLYPVGLDPTPIPSFDYEPIFPWMAPMLTGLAAAGLLRPRPGMPATDLLARMGRHSLVVYLLHQPVLMGILQGLLAIGLV